MKDDPEFNIYFISLIEAHPCLYDHTSEEYCKKNLQVQAWNKVSKEVKETVKHCKERWKNLRGAYTRHLKNVYAPIEPDERRKKPYYLAGYMEFLLPFTKSRSKKTPSNSDPNHLDESTDGIFEEVESEDSSDPLPDTAASAYDSNSHSGFKSTPTSFPAAKKRRLSSDKSSMLFADVDRSVLEHFESKNAFVQNSEVSEDPDTLFLSSVLPDMKKMTDSQKRRFKIAILTAAENILEEPISNPNVASVTSNQEEAVELKNIQAFSVDSKPTLERL